MQISSRFTIALHIFACIAIFGDKDKITSDYLAESINVNPVIIRNIMLQLKRSNLIEVKRGHGGIKLSKDLKNITFFDVYEAVESVKESKLFKFHEKPEINCPVGRNIEKAVEPRLSHIQTVFEDEMKRVSLDILAKDISKLIEN